MYAKYKLIFGLILLLFISLAAIAYLNLKYFEKSTNSIDHSHQVIHSLQKIYAGLKDAQANYADFLLTQNSNYSMSCNSDMEEVQEESKRIGDLAGGDPLLQKNMDNLKDLVDKKCSSMRNGLDEAMTGHVDLAVRSLQKNSEKKSNEDIKALVDEMSRIQVWLLKNGKIFEDAETEKSSRLVVWGSLSALMICALAGYFINRQISERQAALNQLKSSEEKFRFLTETANDSFITTDSQGAITDINPAGEGMFGFSKSELAGNPLSLLMPQKFNHEGTDLSIEKFITNVSAIQTLEISGRRKDSSVFPLEVSVSKWETKAGTFYTTISRDITERKFFIKTLLNNEHRLFQFLDAIPLGVLVRDPTGAPYYSNQAHNELFGTDMVKNKTPINQTPEAHHLFIAGTNQHYPFDQLPGAKALLGEKCHIDDIELHLSNRVIPLEAWGTPIQDEKGGVKFTLTAIMDVSRQREIHEATKEREEFFRNLFEESPIGMTLSFPDGTFVNVNRAFGNMLGYSKNELVGRSIQDFTFSDDRPTEKSLDQKLFDKILPKYQIEIRYTPKKGGFLWCKVSASVIRNLEDEPLFRLAIVENISEQKNIELELRESGEKFRILTESANDAIISIDSKGAIIIFNPAAEKIFGYTQAEALGKPFTFLMVAASWKANMELIQNYLASGKSTIPGRTLELDGKRKNGEEFPAEISYFSWKTESGIFFTSIMRDITWRKQVEEMKNDLISVVSHQLKTPVAEINGYIENMLDGVTGDLSEIQREYLMDMRVIGNRNYRLISDLLSMSKIERGVMTVDLNPVRLGEIVELALSDYESMSAKKNLKFTVDKTPSDIWVHADKEKSAEALRNIIDNAIKCTDQGSIRIHPMRQGRFGGIEVSDTGIGMTAATLERLFTKSRVLGSEASRSGAGLGLYIAKSFMNLQKGDITVTSELGKGSTFCVTMPITEDKGGTDV